MSRNAEFKQPETVRARTASVGSCVELGIHGLKGHGRNWSRKVRETRSSSSQKRSEPATLPCRGPGGQAGDEHGGPRWLKRGVEPGRAPAGEGRELLTPWVDEQVRSPSHRGAVSFK